MNNRNRFVSTGIVSLFMIFTVFCMVILALLTFQTSKTDLENAAYALHQTAAYYDACAKASDLCRELNEQCSQIYYESSDYDSFLENLTSLSLPESVFYDAEEKCFILDVPFSQTQSLHVSIQLPSRETSMWSLSVHDWYTMNIGDWTPDLHQNVLQKGENQ